MVVFSMSLSQDHLPQDIKQLSRMVRALDAENADLKAEVDYLKRLIHGARSEKLATIDPAQTSLALGDLSDIPVAANDDRPQNHLSAPRRSAESAEVRYHARQSRSAAIMRSLKARLLESKADISTQSALAKAINYTLKHWTGLTAFLDNGTIEVDSNVVERSMKSAALTRKNSMFVGNARGGETFAILASLINQPS